MQWLLRMLKGGLGTWLLVHKSYEVIQHRFIRTNKWACTLYQHNCLITRPCKLPCLFCFINFVCPCLPMPECDNLLWLWPLTMAPPVSLELCERIVVWRYELNMSIDNITQLSGHSKWTVNYVLETYQNYGQVVNPFIQPQGLPQVLDWDDLNFIDSVLAAELSLYLDEIQEKLCIFQDIDVSGTVECK